LGSNGTEKALKLGCLFGSLQNSRDCAEKSWFCVPTGHWRFAKTAAKVGRRSMFCENALPGQPIAAMMRAQNMLSKA
jgi:hypothetical protein